MTAEGEIDTPLDEEGVRKATARLRAFGVTSIAISFLHSYLNNAHELQAREIVLDEYPDVEMVSLSHEVLPKPPEFERTSTTLVNAYVGPPIARYLGRLTERLAEAGYAHELLVATSSGGVATAEAAARRAVATIGSGPTGGVHAAARAATTAGLGDVVSVDMGGTSYDLCLIRDGRPDIKMDWNWFHRYCIGIPMIDIPSVGAGGGSIVWEEGGVLHVGPQSAQSQPGPVCYGRGGVEPTVTDADLVLGRLDPVGFNNGRMELDVDGARAALAEVGQRVGLDVEDDRGCRGATGRRAHDRRDPPRAVACRRRPAQAQPGRLRRHGRRPRDDAGAGARDEAGAGAACRRRPVGARAACRQPRRRRLARLHLAGRRGRPRPHLQSLADDLESNARAELSGRERARATGCGSSGRCCWSIPGRPSTCRSRSSTPTDVDAAVTEFHRRNAEARLIEARAQEPILRGVRLTAVGEVDPPARPRRSTRVDAIEPTGHRRMWIAEEWHDDAPLYDMDDVRPGVTDHRPGRDQERVHDGDPGAGRDRAVDGAGRHPDRAELAVPCSPIDHLGLCPADYRRVVALLHRGHRPRDAVRRHARGRPRAAARR